MNNNQTTKDNELAEKLLKELAGDKENIALMMGVHEFFTHGPKDSGDKPHLGGVAFTYPSDLVKNDSSWVVITALPNGNRRMEWHRGTNLELVDSADDVPPEDMEKVWWEHTACAVRPPWILSRFKLHKFELGRTLMSPRVAEEFSMNELTTCLIRHHTGDWGDASDEDKRANELGLKYGNRIISTYKFDDGRKLWIITESEDEEGKRPFTTLLTPEEY